MEGMSRVKKYKSYRESITNGEENLVVKDDQIEELDEENNPLDFPEFSLEDDLSISSEDLDVDGTKESMIRSKDENGEGVSYNTRLDILQQIKAANMHGAISPTPKKGERTVTEIPEVKKEEKEDHQDDFQQSISDIIQNDELKIKKEVKEPVVEIKEEILTPVQQEEVELDDDDIIEDEKASMTEKILTFVIVICSIALIALIGYIIKLLYLS